ncbi:MAG: pyridoxamine 5'-phosphate oxidase [Pseudomonadota bacterium]
MRDQRDTRNDYGSVELTRDQLPDNPHTLFEHWLETANAEGQYDFTAMTLATADADGVPSARVVLLKHFDEDGFCWYTDTESRKGRELQANPRAALLFYWATLHRQIRITGPVSRLPDSAADSYFASRPAGSQHAAAASHQSQVLADRATLEHAVSTFEAEAHGGPIERPARWGGYCLRAESFEFWQGRTSRLHDRFLYQRLHSGWQIDRLSP